MDREVFDQPGPWAALGLQRSDAAPKGALPSGWWVVPGVVLGLGLWLLIGFGLHAAMTSGDDAGVAVTMAAPMGGGLLTAD